MNLTTIDLETLYGFAIHTISPLPDSDRAWRLTSARGDLVLRLHGAERTAAHVGEMAILQLFEQVGYAAPRVLLTTAGPALFPWAEGEGYLTTWIPGEPPTANADNAFLLGRATGALHAISPAAHNLPAATFTIESARAHFHELDADPAVNGWEGYAQMRIGLHDAWNSLGDLAKLPKTIVHTDVHFGNAVRTPSGEVVLIDWDDTGLGPAITDVGYYLIHQAVPSDEGGDWAPEMARAFLAGYESVRPLAPAERERLPEAMLFGALAYVLAPWEDRVHVGNWRRARAVLDQREEIEAMIAG